jgi:hypothetical protein
MRFSPASCLFIPLSSKYSPQYPVLKHPQINILPLMRATKKWWLFLLSEI